ncbi:hypothetical protein SK128_023521 [Halocaridina rubra]|uniref:Uncharacterized protein n=1 Tax=Halocaridina rubra TaxID=373956 RepID=A0AAN9AAP2_HALRR
MQYYSSVFLKYALGVGGGWVVVGVDGEVRVWLGGGGCRPCHQGPVMDLMLLGSHLYTVGGDGWLRMWEAETLEEAAVKAGGMGTTANGWSEEGMTKAWLQLLREVVVHKGPGVPVTILPMIMPNHSAWIVQTNTGVLYSVWEGEWTSRILHQGPSGRVTGVAIAPNQPLLAVTSHHRYLQITQLPQVGCRSPQISAEGLNGAEGKRHIKVPTAIAQAEIPGSPRCVTWAICQVTEEDNLLVVGLEDGSINLYLLHITPKLSNTQLTLVQMERPHELPVVFISASSTQQKESSNHLPVVVTASEDCRIFIFCLVKAGKVTKLEPVGFHQLEAVAERVEVKGAVIIVEMNAGIVLEIPLPTTISSVDNSPSGETSIMSNRISPDSWLLQCHTNRRELWEGSTVVRKQLLEEAAQAYCTEEPHAIVVLTMPSLDGKTMLGVTALGRVVHLHQSQDSYSIRLSRRSSVSLQMSPESPTSKMQKTLRLSSESPAGERKSSTPDLKVDNLALSPGRQSRRFSSRRGSPKRLPSVDEEDIKCVVGCVSRDGSWVTAWIEGNDLLVYCAKGTSFPTPHPKELQLRLVAIRGVVIAESGPSLEQRAQKEARERQKVAMEEKASLLQQKLSKLKWDFKKLSLRGDAIEGGQQLLEDLPLHPTITSSLNNQTTQNMNKVVGGSSGDLERLEVLLGKLRTLFSWNPLVNLLVVTAFE